MAYPADGTDDDPTLTGDKRIIHRAHQRFQRCKLWYDEAYSRSLEDTKFANADDRNKWQWPDKIYAARDEKRKPCLTINITEPHNRLVINESMQNKASIRVRATGGKATAEAAEGMQALIDRTEYISSAMIAYRTAITHQVDGGFGYLFLETAFVDTKSFDQDVYIKVAPDPRAVYLDPDTKEPDGSDAQFGFVFDKVPRDRFNREHRRFKDKVGKSTLGEDVLWISDKHVLVVMYYERSAKNDELISYKLPDGSDFSGHRSDLERDAGPELVDQVIEQIDNGEIDGQYRDVITQEVNWYLIGGDCILKRGDQPKTRWIGQYIPIIPCTASRPSSKARWTARDTPVRRSRRSRCSTTTPAVRCSSARCRAGRLTSARSAPSRPMRRNGRPRTSRTTLIWPTTTGCRRRARKGGRCRLRSARSRRRPRRSMRRACRTPSAGP
jgi:hypothetical protein